MIMKKTTLLFLIIAIISIGLFPIHSKSFQLKESPKIETFDAWWGWEYNDCTITFKSTTSSSPGTLQVDKGVPIEKDQILEVSREEQEHGWWKTKHYLYKIIYKDSNSKVSTAVVIFANRNASQDFQRALESFGIN